jgi:nucleoside-triphosphatase THEP1
MSDYRGAIWVVTGDREIGKTRFCLELLKQARDDEIKTAGIVSPPVFFDGVKQSIQIENVKTEEFKTLAKKRTEETTGLFTHRWVFDEEVINWGNEVLATATPCELLFVDELGPLEFNRGEGLLEGLHAIDSRKYKSAVVVIRPELLITATIRWPDIKVLDIKPFMNKLMTINLMKKILQQLHVDSQYFF